MSSLIVQSEGPAWAAVFDRRVMIGRKPFNAVQFESRTISRIHAWLDRDGEDFYVADAKSRAGTTVNGEKIHGKVVLKDGDVIGIGRFTVIFKTTNELPADAMTFEIAPDGSNATYEHRGIMMQCTCGAPLWVPASMAGAYGHCAVCKGDITVPGTPFAGIRRPLTPNDSLAELPAISDEEACVEPVMANAIDADTADAMLKLESLAMDFPRPKPSAKERLCKVCQEPVRRDEPHALCPACGQVHHSHCWETNGGCASYGCTHSAADKTLPLPIAARLNSWQTEVPPSADRPRSPLVPALQIPHEMAMVGTSIFGLLLGAFTFGVPSLAVATATTFYAVRRRDAAARIAAISAGISVLGVGLGVITSSLLWFSRPWWGH